MSDTPEATSASPKCEIDIQVQLAGEWVDAECDMPVKWALTVSVGGPFSAPSHRCAEHIGGTLDFHLNEPTTKIVTVARAGR